MALEPFIFRTSRRSLDDEARNALEGMLQEQAPNAKFRIRWDWSEDRNILNVRTTLIRWEVHFGNPNPDDLSILADIPAFVKGMLSEEKRNRFRNTIERALDDLGF